MDDDSRPSKRRKLSTSPETDHVPFHVVLARHRFPAQLTVNPGENALPLQIPLAIHKIESADDGRRLVYFKHRWLRSITVSNEREERGFELLEHARSLPSLASRADPQSLQACHTASLSLDGDDLVLVVQLLWRDTTSMWEKQNDVATNILCRYLRPPSPPTPTLEDWHPRDFYDNVHVPSRDDHPVDPDVQRFRAKLYPFQRRTLKWMLEREHFASETDSANSAQKKPQAKLPDGFSQVTGIAGQALYVNYILGVVSSNLEEVRQTFDAPRGGLLAEEMGLGKTVAVIGAVCAHSRHLAAAAGTSTRLRESGATLIITPTTLLEQWRDEITEHSSLRVVHYDGIASAKGKKETLQQHIDHLVNSDIVLTTYNVIAREVHYVVEKPKRSLRHEKVYEAPKSPLTEISWWRVCLDEAQMIESGVSNAAKVARLIPREIAWAVTGTPLRQTHKDLYGLMLFLNYQPWGVSLPIWERLVAYHRPLFRSLINTIAIRHTKDFVREDLKLPPQSRHTITLPFTAIEEQHYENMFHQMCNDVNLRVDGSPRTDDWDPEDPKIVEEMRHWLTRLRQTCLHPEVGRRNRKALGRGTGPLRTVGQVLDVMIDQAEGNLRLEQRALLMSKTRRGQMLENAKRPREALDLWNAAYTDATVIVEECQKRLDEELQRQAEDELQHVKSEHQENFPEEDEVDATVQTHRQRLRFALEIQHVCVFFTANAYFQLKSDEEAVTPESDEFHAFEKLETEAYDVAKRIRAQLLGEVLKKANTLIKAIQTKKATGLPEALQALEPHDEYSGIESRRVFEKFHHLCEAMNEQSNYFATMRSKMIDFLLESLIDDDAGIELQGDEYEASTKHQDEMYVYMEALRVLFGDRGEAVNGLENMLIKHEVRSFLRQAKEGEGPAPELMLKLLAEREAVRINAEKQGSLRGMVTEVRHLMSNLQTQEAAGSTRARAERDVATRLLDYVQDMANTRSRSLAQLEQEVNLFRDTMNSRLDYYRALQKVSDTVAPYEEEMVGQPLNEDVFYDTLRGEEAVIAKISTLMSKRRYLLHLRDESDNQAERNCTICQTSFEVGTLTVCGHTFCKECIQAWWKERRNCPICKRHLHPNDFHDITYKPAEMAVQAESPPSSDGGSSSSSPTPSPTGAIYSSVSTKTLNEIKNIDLHGGSFGSKIDAICRHVKWLRDQSFNTKSIIFSQYQDFLEVLSRAFDQHNIQYTAFDKANGIQKFKTEPGIECFLLHAKAHSAGLNLVCASHVILCEPLLATAVELQAIARVHRIGQHNATTVWMYVIGGTVEESIYELSVARRLDHIKRNVKKIGKTKAGSSNVSGTATPKLGENVLEAANSLELQEADMKKLLSKGRSGGENVDKADLWQCLFGKTRSKEQVMRRDSDKAADEEPAGGEIGRFLRAEAAQARAQ